MKIILFILFSFPFWTSTGDTAPTSGTITNRAGGTDNWTNPGNILADDASIASVVTFSQTHYLVASGFGFSIPSGSIIKGVTVKIEAYTDFSTPQLRAILQDDAGAVTGTFKFNSMSGGAVYTVYTYGSTSDVWGATLTPAVVNDADFGVRIWVESISDVRVDYVTIAIEYSNRRTAVIN